MRGLFHNQLLDARALADPKTFAETNGERLRVQLSSSRSVREALEEAEALADAEEEDDDAPLPSPRKLAWLDE